MANAAKAIETGCGPNSHTASTPLSIRQTPPIDPSVDSSTGTGHRGLS
jgi:hypothetical protein